MRFAGTQAHLPNPSLCVAAPDLVAEKAQLLPHPRYTRITSPSTRITPSVSSLLTPSRTLFLCVDSSF